MCQQHNTFLPQSNTSLLACVENTWSKFAAKIPLKILLLISHKSIIAFGNVTDKAWLQAPSRCEMRRCHHICPKCVAKSRQNHLLNVQKVQTRSAFDICENLHVRVMSGNKAKGKNHLYVSAACSWTRNLISTSRRQSFPQKNMGSH